VTPYSPNQCSVLPSLGKERPGHRSRRETKATLGSKLVHKMAEKRKLADDRRRTCYVLLDCNNVQRNVRHPYSYPRATCRPQRYQDCECNCSPTVPQNRKKKNISGREKKGVESGTINGGSSVVQVCWRSRVTESGDSTAICSIL